MKKITFCDYLKMAGRPVDGNNREIYGSYDFSIEIYPERTSPGTATSIPSNRLKCLRSKVKIVLTFCSIIQAALKASMKSTDFSVYQRTAWITKSPSTTSKPGVLRIARILSWISKGDKW